MAYAAQTAACVAIYALLRLLPLDAASAVGGWLLRAVGPRMALSRRAATNLRLAYPGIDQARVERIIAGMWDNLGRVGAEYARLASLWRQPQRVQVVGGDIMEGLARAGRPILFFGGHLANWEAIILAAQRHGLDPCMVYRPFNNPFFERFWCRLRRANGAEYITVRVGTAGMRRIVHVLERAGQAILLVDQRMDRGRPIPFFGRPAMTSTVLARLAARFDAAVVPARVERVGGTAFRVTLEPPLGMPRSGDRRVDEAEVMTAANRRLEAWIRACPEQWMWLHRRWRKADTSPEEAERYRRRVRETFGA